MLQSKIINRMANSVDPDEMDRSTYFTVLVLVCWTERAKALSTFVGDNMLKLILLLFRENKT